MQTSCFRGSLSKTIKNIVFWLNKKHCVFEWNLLLPIPSTSQKGCRSHSQTQVSLGREIPSNLQSWPTNSVYYSRTFAGLFHSKPCFSKLCVFCHKWAWFLLSDGTTISFFPPEYLQKRGFQKPFWINQFCTFEKNSTVLDRKVSDLVFFPYRTHIYPVLNPYFQDIQETIMFSEAVFLARTVYPSFPVLTCTDFFFFFSIPLKGLASMSAYASKCEWRWKNVANHKRGGNPTKMPFWKTARFFFCKNIVFYQGA